MNHRNIILQYHYFGNYINRYYIAPHIFREQIEIISNREDILVTIDDGDESFYEIAYPILVEYNVPSILFIDTQGINNRRMSKIHLREISDAGINIQSHSHTHRNHYLLSDHEIIKEGRLSRSIINKITGKPVNHYSFPEGAYDIGMCKILHEIGYDHFYTSDYGIKKISLNGLTIHDRIEAHKNKSLNYYFRWDVKLLRRIRIEFSKKRMKYFPKSYNSEFLYFN